MRVPSGLDVRPTPERVREALFSILRPRLEGPTVLDAYAGTGALGLEALSRGARRVTFIESERRVCDTLRRNIDSLGVADRCRVVHGEVEAKLPGMVPDGPFDLVLADPPYAAGSAGPFVGCLEETGALARGGMVVYQRDRRTPPFEGRAGGLTLVRTARYGRTCLDFYAASGGPSP
jgi:16S rRNA (guanine(966)-N(2))-methyltransferase RsmD